MKTVFVNPERCIGCKQCETACAVAHSQSKNLFLSVFETPLPKPRIHVERGFTTNTAFPNKCRHCNPGPCLSACPTGALYRAEDGSGSVLINPQKCIACGMCAMVCPFDAIAYHASAQAPHRTMVALKCDHCAERQQLGLEPACVEACKTGALEFGEINEIVKAGRTRYAAQVSATFAQGEAESAPTPASIQGWRGWGAAVDGLNTNGQKGA